MKSKTKIVVAIGIVAVLVVIGGIIYSKMVADLPKDNAQLSEVKFENLMGTRYTEILLVFGNVLTGNYTAGVYNTIGLNGANPAGGGDSTPSAIVDKIDLKKLKEETDSLKAIKNGPRLWTVDYVGVKMGKERDFQGLKARWIMWYPIPEEIRKGSMENPYKFMTAHRDTSMGIRKGSRVYILDDPEGKPWVMKSASLIKDPNQKFEDLKDLGSRLKPPTGWKFRTLILEQDLVFLTDKGTAHITQDELGNTYDLVGGVYSNYKP